MVAITNAWGDVRDAFRKALPACFHAAASIAHDFPAFLEPDGTYTIRGLPVFAVTTDSREAYHKDGAVEFGEAWLRDARAFHREQQAKGYFAPVQVQHTGWPGRETRYGGLFANHDILDYPDPETGELIPTLFADIVSMPAEVYRDVEQLRLPFRSVEIPPERYPGGSLRPGFSKLCLLDQDDPYFHHPITRPRLVQMGRAGGLTVGRRFALASELPSGGRALLFAFTPARFCCMDPTNAPPVAPPPAAPAPAAGPSPIEQKLDRILEILEGALSEPEEPAAPVSQPPGPEGQAKMAAQNGGFVTAAQFAALSAEVQTTRADNQRIKTEREIDARIAAWKDRRFAFDEGRVRKEAAQFAAKGALREYLDSAESTFAAFGQAPPAPTDGRTAPSPGTKTIDPKDPVLGQFAAMPKAVQDEAAHWLGVYRANPSLHDIPAEKYVAGMVKAELRDAGSSEHPQAAEFRAAHNVLRMANGRGGK